ncbi:MAG: deoxyribonuclease IV [Thermoguttaceae bacterium]|nr:deoxyribonuclease IV [Thermoguttaceae bacterium]MDW8079319.1 deoxyribonuclease IV [Thermoguttaceae bacterium]
MDFWQVSTDRFIVGAHMSIAGGYHRAVERAAALGCDCVQIFTQNNLRWETRRVSTQEAKLFREALVRHQIVCPLVHANYLINLASPDGQLWRRSIRAFAGELRRAAALGIPWVVFHPGAATDGQLDRALSRVVRALNQTLETLPPNTQVGCLIEVTAGQGHALGSDLEQIRFLLAEISRPDRVGVCLDTCHLFAAGYPLAPASAYEQTTKLLEKTVGLARIKAIHLNDSRGKLGSRVDRHMHIGRGQLGLEAFRLIVNDKRFFGIPMYIETPKEKLQGQDMDQVNMKLLRSLVPPERASAAALPH